MTWLLIVFYLVLHFTLFVFIFRHHPRFRSEGGVLLLHVASAVALVAGMLVWFGLSPSQTRLAFAVGAGAAHGIYSLSFLEIWALSDGGYSLRVLAAVVSRGQSTAAKLEAHFTALSSGKKEGRLDSLFELGLVQKDENTYALTPRGNVVAKFIAGIGYLAKLEKTG